jgi:uncharacterized membrane protein YtjA (UPF0391 family)
LYVILRILRSPRVFSASPISRPLDLKAFPNGRQAALLLALDSEKENFKMLNWAVTFFIIALVAAVLGFTGVAVAAAGVAKILFVVFLVLFLVSLIAHTTRRV